MLISHVVDIVVRPLFIFNIKT